LIIRVLSQMIIGGSTCSTESGHLTTSSGPPRRADHGRVLGLSIQQDGRVPDQVWSPEEAASRLAEIPDERLPLLAADWLASGLDSEVLREVAGMSRSESLEARRKFPDVLASLGCDIILSGPKGWLSWRGEWKRIEWAIGEMTAGRFAPYATAQVVMEGLEEEPDLWGPVGGPQMVEMLLSWDQEPTSRVAIDRLLKTHLLSLSESDVPPLRRAGH
jgi:hypothetical protein